MALPITPVMMGLWNWLRWPPVQPVSCSAVCAVYAVFFFRGVYQLMLVRVLTSSVTEPHTCCGRLWAPVLWVPS